jgi:hypothetical protein
MEKWGRKGKKTRNRETGGKGKEKRVRGNRGRREVGEMDAEKKRGKGERKGEREFATGVVDADGANFREWPY